MQSGARLKRPAAASAPAAPLPAAAPSGRHPAWFRCTSHGRPPRQTAGQAARCPRCLQRTQAPPALPRQRAWRWGSGSCSCHGTAGQSPSGCCSRGVQGMGGGVALAKNRRRRPHGASRGSGAMLHAALQSSMRRFCPIIISARSWAHRCSLTASQLAPGGSCSWGKHRGRRRSAASTSSSVAASMAVAAAPLSHATAW